MRPQAVAMKALLNEPAMQVVPGCGDGLGARLVEEAGFRIGFASGSSISAMRLAMPDMDLLTFPEMRDAVEAMIAAAPNVLWLADGDTGYGNAIAVQKTIRAYARAGAAAAREEGVLLLARTDARSSRGFEEALVRLQDFVAEGADIFFLDSPATEAEMRASVEACQGKPALAVTHPGGQHFMPVDDVLAAIGIKMVVHPQAILAATVLAVRAALAGLKSGPQAAMADAADLGTAIRTADYVALDQRLARGG